jgi:hypothetical protein
MIGFLVVAINGISLLANEVFVIPRVEIRAGYENNRMEESGSGEGTPFWQVAPGLDVTMFRDKSETSLLLDYRQTQYTKTDFDSKDEASALAKWRYFGGQTEVGASIGGGFYQDTALSYDDNIFWLARPYLIRTLEGLPIELTLNGYGRQSFYDTSSSTSTLDRVDTRMEVRPGLQWHLSEQATLWTELYGENNSSDAKEAEYTGFGWAIGGLFRPLARMDCGAWAETGKRFYSEQADGGSRDDTPWRVGAWTDYRLRPWLELFSSAEWESNASTINGNQYSWWRIDAGVKFTFEYEID